MSFQQSFLQMQSLAGSSLGHLSARLKHPKKPNEVTKSWPNQGAMMGIRVKRPQQKCPLWKKSTAEMTSLTMSARRRMTEKVRKRRRVKQCLEPKNQHSVNCWLWWWHQWQSIGLLFEQVGFKSEDRLRLSAIQNCWQSILTGHWAFSNNCVIEKFFFPVSYHNLPL